MRFIPATARERNTARTILSLERLVADSTKPEVMRRAATLRLGRLRAALRGNKPLTLTAQPATATKATPPPSSQACFEALQSFRALSRQRSALFRKRRTTAEQSIFVAMNLLMPSAAPSNDDPKEWAAFIDRISLLLSEIKSI